MNSPRPILQRLADADRVHQREAGRKRLLRGVKWALLAALGIFAADVFFHLDSWPRLLLLLGVIAGGLALLAASAWLAYVRRNPPEHTARLLEQRDPNLGSKLINVLQLQAQTNDPKLAPLTRELAQQAVASYNQRLADAPLEQLARTDQVRRELRWAGLALLAFAVVLGAFHKITRVELARFADPFGDHPPYSFTQLAIVEPGPEGTNILYGKSALVKVKSSGHRPKDLFLTIHPVDQPGRATTFAMLDKGAAGFHQSVDDIRSDLVAYAHTKDRKSVSKRVPLGVIRVPQWERAWVEIAPPAYTGLKPQEKAYALRSVDALAGSQVRFRIQSNRPLRSGWLEVVTPEGATNRVELQVAETNLVAGAFTARESGRLRFGLLDVDNIPSQGSWEGSLTVTHDLPPEIRLAEPQRDSFVALDFTVNAIVEANDDYGLSQVRLHRALNGVYSAPKVIRYDTVVRGTREALVFDFDELGVRPSDVISFFAEAVDTSPAGQMARSQTINLSVISVEDYNEFLRERSDIGQLQGKYDELWQQLHEQVAEQQRLAEAAGQAKEDLARAESAGDSKAKEALQRELDALLAKQHELNARLNQAAKRMEEFVRDQPMYDIEAELSDRLKEMAERIRESTAENSQATRQVAQQSSPADGSRQLSPEMLDRLQQAAADQAKRLGGIEQQAAEEVQEPLADLARLHELMKDFNQFEALYQAQQALTEQARAYNRSGQLNREDQLALRDLASREREVGELLDQLREKLQSNAKAAEIEFPKAAASARQLAEKIGDLRLTQLAWNATRSMLAAQGEGSYQAADRLRGEMEKLFAQCNSEGGRPGPQELDQYLSLNRSQGRPGAGMKPGQTFSQMLKSRNFRGPGGRQGRSGSGEGQAGESGYAVGQPQALDVMGREAMVQRGETGRQEARAGGVGQAGVGANGSVGERSDVLKNLKPVNRQSGAVQSESLLEEYSDVVDSYFRAITK